MKGANTMAEAKKKTAKQEKKSPAVKAKKSPTAKAKKISTARVKADDARIDRLKELMRSTPQAVSYTHLTLPTTP